MYLQVLGIGGAFTAIHYNTSYYVETPSTRLLIDGPHSLLRILNERKIDAESVDSILLTHVHGDHAAGAESLLLWRKYILGRKTVLYTSRRVYRQLEDHFFGSFAETFSHDLKEIIKTRFEDYVEFKELREDSVNRIAPDLAIEIRHNWHPTPALGLKIHLGASTIGISGDTCYSLSLLQELRSAGTISHSNFEKLAGDWLWESDLIYHEASQSAGGGHTGEGELLALSPEIRSRIRLVHVSDSFQGTLPIAREGEKARVGTRGHDVTIEPPHTS